MTSKRLITLLRELTENQYTDSVLMMWLSNCENTVLTDVLLASPEDCVELTEQSDAKMIVPHPWDKLYLPYMQAQVAHANGEYDHYANYIALFNAYLEEYARHILETAQPAGGEAVTRGYYLSAYAIAVEHGYKGTVEQWLESLIGPQGDGGKDAYTIAVENGFNGTVEQWLASMKGDAATVEIVGATALAAGDAPTVTEAEGSTPAARRYKLGIPKGDKGDTGGTSLPIARAYVPEGHDDAYTATWDLIPVVSVANNPEQVHAVWKGMQIIFIPVVSNKTQSPTLRINGGEAIPIRMRWYTNKGTNENAPEATTNVEVGSLMRGVPYTLTFCGKYWLVDSQITQFDDVYAGFLRKQAEGMSYASDGSGASFTVMECDGEGLPEYLTPKTAEIHTGSRGEPGDYFEIPTIHKVSDMIRQDVSREWHDFSQANENAEYVDFAKTMNEGHYIIALFIEETVYIDVILMGTTNTRFIRIETYTDQGYYTVKTYDCLDGTPVMKMYYSSEEDVLELGSHQVITNRILPIPTSSDNGKFLGCEGGKAEWMPVEELKGADGKSAYQYAKEGGFTGTETEFAEKLAQEMLSGTTDELTPTQVYDAVSAGIPVKVQYVDDTFGVLSYTNFSIAESMNAIGANTISYFNDVYILGELLGNTSNNEWFFMSTSLAQKIDIPTALPNPNAITFTGAVTGSYNGSAPLSVNIPSAVTDAHINSLIDTKLGVIENGSY